jgi:hypothetical protein
MLPVPSPHTFTAPRLMSVSPAPHLPPRLAPNACSRSCIMMKYFRHECMLITRLKGRIRHATNYHLNTGNWKCLLWQQEQTEITYEVRLLSADHRNNWTHDWRRLQGVNYCTSQNGTDWSVKWLWCHSNWLNYEIKLHAEKLQMRQSDAFWGLRQFRMLITWG